MDVEEDLLIVDEVGVSSQQAGREQTSARPVFSDPERIYCRVADPGQERLCRSEGSGGYSYADAVRDRNSDVARRKSTIGAQRGASFSNITGFRCSRSQGDSPNFLGDRYEEKPRIDFLANNLGNRFIPTQDISGFRCQGNPKLQEFGLNELRLASSRSASIIRKTEHDRRRNKILGNSNRCRATERERDTVEHESTCDSREPLHSTGVKSQKSLRYVPGTIIEASQVLWDLTGLGYQGLVSKLEDRFGTRGHEESYRYKLQILRRKPGEQSRLATHLARNFFLSALDNAELELKVREKEPKNIDDALRFNPQVKDLQAGAENMESMVRQIAFLQKSFEELRNKRAQPTVSRVEREKICFNCKKPGVPAEKNDKQHKSIESSDRVMYLPTITINGKRRLGLLDSGSSVSIVPTSMVDITKVRPTEKRLKAANNTEIPVKGEMKLQIKVDDYSKSALVLVSDHVSEIVLGLDWLRNNHILWKKLCRIEAHAEVRIPARTELDVPAKMIVRQPSKLESTEFMCSKNRQIESGVYVARTLLSIKYEGQCVRILNVNDQPRVINRGTRLPDLSSAVEAKKSVDRLAYENLTEVTGMVDGLVKDISKKARKELIQILKSFSDRFSCASGEIGAAKGVFHKIDTQDARPVKQQLRRHSPAHQKVIAELVEPEDIAEDDSIGKPTEAPSRSSDESTELLVQTWTGEDTPESLPGQPDISLNTCVGIGSSEHDFVGDELTTLDICSSVNTGND
ncbi:hypothetical protein HELRODRAFT_164908 [Helobdella robusta]|uniref:Peptidase A2 domain-containing protein n=1 Tax=Helobdella robusta TaxID=6412 RepID=T1EVY5_HELRO|nr:hypothetical protein HELRODRAFT_164908 [Helobdella robusta]ESN92791.1 hypothetical protein HELRODRAFT_164908 [Helobdella robusta]